MTEQEMLDKIQRLITRAERAEAARRQIVVRQQWLEESNEVLWNMLYEYMNTDEAHKEYRKRMDAIERATVDL